MSYTLTRQIKKLNLFSFITPILKTTLKTMSMPIEDIVLTRFLYSKEEVKQSLFLGLINRSVKEALYWAYELYYSGFEKEVFQYVFSIYLTIYQDDNPSLRKWIKDMYKEWKQGTEEEKDFVLGSIIQTLVGRTYNLTMFIKRYFGVTVFQVLTPVTSLTPVTPVLTPIKKKKLNIRLTNGDVEKYKEKQDYSIKTTTKQLFQTIGLPDRLGPLSQNQILYYAAKSPIWEDRLLASVMNEQMDTILKDDDKQEIVFLDPDQEHAFYQKYDLTLPYPDPHLGDESQYGLKDFCANYGLTIPTKKLQKGAK
jgi:hypothetical protein